jgi:hypothetical protein
MKTGKPYLAYLLRLWRVRMGGAPVWMASLESTASGERHGFADLEAMLAFLRRATAQAGEPQDCQAKPGKEAASKYIRENHENDSSEPPETEPRTRRGMEKGHKKN